MLQVRLIGPPRIVGPTGERPVRGHKPWAVLARLLLADRPMLRREVAAELFPEAEDPLGSLRWCLAGLRKALGSAELLVGDPLDAALPADITVDVLQLLAGEDDAPTRGELLEGIDPRCGPGFSLWLLVTRQQIAARIDARLREQTIVSLTRGEPVVALRCAEALVGRAPFDEGAHVLLVKALVAADQREAALTHIASVEADFERELGCGPSPAVRSAAREQVGAPPPGVAPATIIETLLESGREAVAAGAIDAGVDCIRQASARAESLGDDVLLAECLLTLGSTLVHGVRGFDDEGQLLLDRAAHLAAGAGATPIAAAAHCERGYVDALAGRRLEAARHLREAEALAVDVPRVLANVHATTGFNLADWGRLDDAVDRYERAVDSARSAEDPRREAWALGLGAWALLGADRPAEGIRWAEDCLALVRELRWGSFEPWPTSVLAETSLRRDLPTGASDADAIERCFARSCQLADPCWEGASGRVVALRRAHDGALDDAIAWIADARTRALRMPDAWAGLVGAILLTEVDLRIAAGDEISARVAAREAVSLAARAQLDGMLPAAMDRLGTIGPDTPAPIR